MGSLLRSIADSGGSVSVEVESQEQLELLPSLNIVTSAVEGRAEEVGVTSVLQSGRVAFWLNDTESVTPEMAAMIDVVPCTERTPLLAMPGGRAVQIPGWFTLGFVAVHANDSDPTSTPRSSGRAGDQ